MNTNQKYKKKLNIFNKIILVLNIIAALALLLSYLAPSTDPRDFWIIAILGFGYQFLLIANVVFLIYWVILLRVYAVISAVCILLGFGIFTSYFKFSSQQPIGEKMDSTNIRVIGYNVHEFKGIDEFEGRNTQKNILELIKSKQPDIISFQEYFRYKTEIDTVLNSLKKDTSIKNYFKMYQQETAFHDSSGNAIFSKYPIIDSGYIKSPETLNVEAIFVDIKRKNEIFRVYCIHLAAVQIQGTSKSNYLRGGKLNLGKSDFIISKLKLAFIERSYQVSLIKRHMENCPYPYILTGDFNDTPISFSVNQLGDGLKNAFNEKGHGMGVTYYSKFPKLQIDYILASPQFDILNYEAVEAKISDHYPIVSDLRLK